MTLKTVLLIITTLSVLCLTDVIRYGDSWDSNESDDGKSIEIKSYILPVDPMVIKLVPSSRSSISVPRIEYKGCYKFCVGTVTSQPSQENRKIWDPFNQTCDQLYYFRYVDVNMTECQWSKKAGLSIPELFFGSQSQRRAYGSDTDGNSQYVLSLPTRVRKDRFSFLIYHPDPDTYSSWTVRWTGFMNTCHVNASLPIKHHYEPGAFHPNDYVHF